MGAPKQLLDFGGQPLLRHAASVALLSGCTPVVVVLGAREQEIRPALAGLPVEVVVNERWMDGVGTSIHAGLRALAERNDVRGVVLGLVDQPLVTPEFVCALVTRLENSGAAIVASRHAGTVGVPACFSRETLPLLMALPPDKGCKGVILGQPSDRVLLVNCPEAATDIDTPEDYQRISPHDVSLSPLENQAYRAAAGTVPSTERK